MRVSREVPTGQVSLQYGLLVREQLHSYSQHSYRWRASVEVATSPVFWADGYDVKIREETNDRLKNYLYEPYLICM